jgi:hypothetical protein
LRSARENGNQIGPSSLRATERWIALSADFVNMHSKREMCAEAPRVFGASHCSRKSGHVINKGAPVADHVERISRE